MKKLNSLMLTIYIISLNLISINAFALDDPGFPGNGDPGTPAAPINDWISPMIVLGLIMIYFFFRKNNQTTN